MRREYPGLFQRALCIKIDGVRYSAFGNMLLLRQPDKKQVHFHRRTNGIPTENTPVWEEGRRQLTADAKGGCVLVTPGSSWHHGPRICQSSRATTSVFTT